MHRKSPNIILGLLLLQVFCTSPNSYQKNSKIFDAVLKDPQSIPQAWLTKQVLVEEVEKFCSENYLTQIKSPSAPGYMDHWRAVKTLVKDGDEIWYWSSPVPKPPLPVGFVSANGYCLKRGSSVFYIFEIARSVVVPSKPGDKAFIE